MRICMQPERGVRQMRSCLIGLLTDLGPGRFCPPPRGSSLRNSRQLKGRLLEIARSRARHFALAHLLQILETALTEAKAMQYPSVNAWFDRKAHTVYAPVQVN